MRLISKYQPKTNKIIFAVVLSLLVLTGIFMLQKPNSVEASDDARIFTVYDRGSRQSFRTKASSVRQALSEKNIILQKNDNVEPALDEKLTGTDYSVNIYRAAPVIIQDGKNRLKIMSSGQTAEKIARDAQIKLNPEDRISIESSGNTLEDGAITFLKITRAKLINLDIFGNQKQIRTQAKTIAQLLTDKSITLGEKDGVSKPLSAEIFDGDSIRIWRDGKQTITQEEDVDFITEKINDNEKDTSYKLIKEAGEKGKKTVVYEIETIGGKQVSRVKISEVETKKPKRQIEVVGTKSKTANIPRYTGGGNKDQWLAQSGISPEYWWYVDEIVKKESGWNPNATNKRSGACGLAQALPCSKVGGKGGYDPVSSLQWMNAYVNGRYYDGSPYAKGKCSGAARGWECAWIHWQKFRWY